MKKIDKEVTASSRLGDRAPTEESHILELGQNYEQNGSEGAEQANDPELDCVVLVRVVDLVAVIASEVGELGRDEEVDAGEYDEDDYDHDQIG
jgi:hypothetical protein